MKKKYTITGIVFCVAAGFAATNTVLGKYEQQKARVKQEQQQREAAKKQEEELHKQQLEAQQQAEEQRKQEAAQQRQEQAKAQRDKIDAYYEQLVKEGKIWK